MNCSLIDRQSSDLHPSSIQTCLDIRFRFRTKRNLILRDKYFKYNFSYESYISLKKSHLQHPSKLKNSQNTCSKILPRVSNHYQDPIGEYELPRIIQPPKLSAAKKNTHSPVSPQKPAKFRRNRFGGERMEDTWQMFVAIPPQNTGFAYEAESGK